MKVQIEGRCQAVLVAKENAWIVRPLIVTIGKQFDFIVGPIIIENWMNYFRMLELGCYRFCFAVSHNHRLASKKTLSIKGLY
ncbi:hypothetical protein D7M11_16000 [Paenibacillus ginsengarvi]|uniref:Uncharacterized protein n=2 Tax=Paenibacillus ginsengarvi TaxID=400777 RepID=A0A3B0CAY2_9BACL|nr:hypothetical protein D7M11_16000 [Paenibacillus ginsengarvi]